MGTEGAIHEKKREIIQANSFAGAYRSPFTREDHNQALFPLLEHVNCSYLSSSRNQAPTLLDLKQHAQSLAVLIRHLSISTTSGDVNNRRGEFRDHEAFDWLNNLQEPYHNTEKYHNIGLTTVLNSLRHGLKPTPQPNKEMEPPRAICPMERAHVHDISNQKILPHATHASLAQHANEILERLDHEFSSHGGLLGLLPMHEDDKERVQLGEDTILGQMIAFMRALVLRVHEMEIAYAAALDIVAGEAAVPRELLGEIGAVGRLPTVETLMQDRFVMCTIADEKHEWLQRLLDENERVEPGLDRLTYVELSTRYYRLKGHSVAKTIFVVPQWEGNAVTRALEQRPTVVRVVKPQYPERASEWEEKHKLELARLRPVEPQLWAAQSRIAELEDDVAVLAQEKKQLEMEKRAWTDYARTDPSADQVVKGRVMHMQEAQRRGEELEALKRELEEREEKLWEKEQLAEAAIAAEKRKWIERNNDV